MSDELYNAGIEDLRLVKRLKSIYGTNRTLSHVAFLLSELDAWKGHGLSFGNYPLSLISDAFNEMIYESSYNPYVRGENRKSIDFSEFPLLQEIESLVRSREYWYDIFAYLLFCNKHGYPGKTKTKNEQIKTVQLKHKKATKKDIRAAWKILEKHSLIVTTKENEKDV